MDNKLESLREDIAFRTDKILAILYKHDERLDGIARRLDGIDRQLDGIDGHIGKLVTAGDEQRKRIDKLEEASL